MSHKSGIMAAVSLEVTMKKTITGAILLLLSAQTIADTPLIASPYSGVHMIRGTVFSAGRVDPTVNVGTGYFLDANYSSVFVNVGLGTKKLGEAPFGLIEQDADPDAKAARKRVNNVYAGIGFGRIVQVQAGYGNKGQLMRVRSDFNVRSFTDFFDQRSTPKSRLTLADRLTFTIAIERYTGDDDIFNNFTWGAGLLF